MKKEYVVRARVLNDYAEIGMIFDEKQVEKRGIIDLMEGFLEDYIQAVYGVFEGDFAIIDICSVEEVV